MEDSTVNILTDGKDMVYLHLTKHSFVKKICDLVLINSQRQKGEPCFNIELSSVADLQHVRVACPTTWTSSSINSIANQVVLNASRITNMHIDKIFAKGLIFRPGGLHVLKNVMISHCEINCISVWNALLSFENVTISKCDKPCIVVGKGSHINTINVVIENRPVSIDDGTNYIARSTLDDFDQYTKKRKLTLDFTSCVMESDHISSLRCDLSEYREQVTIYLSL